MLRYTQTNKVAFQLDSTGAVIALLISPELALNDSTWGVIKSLSPLDPVPCEVVLGDYDIQQCCFSCHGITNINTSGLCSKQKTTLYKQIHM